MHEYLHMMHDWPHIAFEFSWEIITFAIAFAFGKVRGRRNAVRDHDAKYHQGEHVDG